MAEAIKINFSGLDGADGSLTVSRDITIADLKLKLQGKIGADSLPYFKLVHGKHVLRDPTALADAFGHSISEAELTLIKLKGPEVLDYTHFHRFVTAIESVARDPSGLKFSAFSLESLRVLNLSRKPKWIEQLMCKEYPGSDCVKDIPEFSAFISAMREMQSLTELDLSDNELSSQNVDPEDDFSDTNPCVNLGEALPRTLEVLVLAHSGWWYAEEFEFLATGLARGAPLGQLRELRVARSSGFCTFGDKDRISRNLAEGLSKCFSHMPMLEKLSLEDCSLRSEHLSELSLPKTIRFLNLVQNFWIDKGACSNVEALVAELPNLEELHLSVSTASDDCAACCSLRNSVPVGCKVQFVAAAPVAKGNSRSVPAASNADLLQGLWTSANGGINIFEDKLTGQLTYVEFIGDGSDCIRAHLKPEGQDAWSGELMLLEEGQEPWYGPSCGEKPETVGEVRVKLCLAADPKQIELSIKAMDEDWAAPVLFRPAD